MFGQVIGRPGEQERSDGSGSTRALREYMRRGSGGTWVWGSGVDFFIQQPIAFGAADQDVPKALRQPGATSQRVQRKERVSAAKTYLLSTVKRCTADLFADTSSSQRFSSPRTVGTRPSVACRHNMLREDGR